jgi:transposase InsO family protein
MARKRYTPEQIIRLLKETEVLSREVFDTLLDAKVLVERWRREYNHIRPHSSLGYRPPAPEVIIPMGLYSKGWAVI